MKANSPAANEGNNESAGCWKNASPDICDWRHTSKRAAPARLVDKVANTLPIAIVILFIRRSGTTRKYNPVINDEAYPKKAGAT